MPRLSLVNCCFSFVCLLLSIFLSSHSAFAAAEDESVRLTEDGRLEIVVTPTRQKTPKKDIAANVAVITREEIEKTPASTAAEVIQYVPGVYVEFNNGPGSVATATIQGSEVRQVAVYMDGVPLNLLANPLTDLSTIPVSSIERIEIHKGTASSAWGSALGGVINIITREPNPAAPFSAEVRSGYGDFETLKEHAAVTGTANRLGYLVSLTHDQSDGFIPLTRYRQNATYAKVNYALDPSSRISFVHHFEEGRNQDPTPLFLDFWDDLYQQRSYERVLFEKALSREMGFTVEARHKQFDATIDDVFTDHTERFFDYTETTYGLSGRLHHDNGLNNRFLAGFDGDWGSFDFSGYANEFLSRNWALYANDTYRLGPLSLHGGLRYDNNRDFGSEVSPSGGVVFHLPWKEALMRLQVARGFSAPPGAWVHDPLYGNKDLQAETGINTQLGGEVKPWPFLTLQTNLFRADVDQLILFNLDTLRWDNVESVTRQGIEGTLKAAFACGLTLSFGGSFIDVRNDDTGDVVKNTPREIYTASAVYNFRWMSHSLVGRYIYHNSSFPETEDRVFVLDYLFKARLPRIQTPFGEACGTPTLYFAVHNLTDADYLFRLSSPQPGRWVEGGIGFEF